MANGHDESAEQPFRFSAKGLASHRKRLGLSAHDCGLLLGASGQSVYKWEEGEVRPRAKHMPAIACAAPMGKKEADARWRRCASDLACAAARRRSPAKE